MFHLDTIFNKTFVKRLLLLTMLTLLASCESLFFYPAKNWVRTPSDINLDYQDIFISLQPDLKLHGWWLPAQGEVKGTVYFLHGNAQNVSTHIASVYWLPEQGYQVFMLDYRGYGHSQGVPGFPAVMDDVKAGWQWLLQQAAVKDRPLYILGQSLGAAVSGYVVATEPQLKQSLSGVVLDAGFASYPRVAKEAVAKSWLTWLLQWPVAKVFRSTYDLETVIKNIQPTPLLVMHGDSDRVISKAHAQRLFDMAGEPKQLLHYSGGHIEAFQFEQNRRALLAFMSGNRP